MIFSRNAVAAAALSLASFAHGLQTGVLIQSCIVSGQVALTIEAGPSQLTPEFLDLLDASGLKGTFFIQGVPGAHSNPQAVRVKDSLGLSVLSRIYASGHQLAMFGGYNGLDLNGLSREQIISEVTQLEDAIMDQIGVRPKMLRSPGTTYNSQTLSVLGELGLNVIGYDIDTQDETNSNNIMVAAANFQSGLDAGGTIARMAELTNSAEVLLPSMIQSLQSMGLSGVTVANCMAVPMVNAYDSTRRVVASSSSSSSAASSTSSIVSPSASSTLSSSSSALTTSAITSSATSSSSTASSLNASSSTPSILSITSSTTPSSSASGSTASSGTSSSLSSTMSSASTSVPTSSLASSTTLSSIGSASTSASALLVTSTSSIASGLGSSVSSAVASVTSSSAPVSVPSGQSLAVSSSHSSHNRGTSTLVSYLRPSASQDYSHEKQSSTRTPDSVYAKPSQPGKSCRRLKRRRQANAEQ